MITKNNLKSIHKKTKSTSIIPPRSNNYEYTFPSSLYLIYTYVCMYVCTYVRMCFFLTQPISYCIHSSISGFVAFKL